MAITVSINVNSATLVNNSGSVIKNLTKPNLLFSSSGITKTSGTNQNKTNITASCTQENLDFCRVSYLKDSTGQKFHNSLVIKLYYIKKEINAQTHEEEEKVKAGQEIILLAPAGKIHSVVWKMNGTIFNENTTNDIKVTGTITVDIKLLSESGSSHNTITELTLFNYYVSAHGYKTSASTPSNKPKLGSHNTPSKAFHRRWSNKWTTSELNEIVPGKYDVGTFVVDGTTYTHRLHEHVHDRSFTFKPPMKDNKIDPPNYYIIIAFKTYISGIGHIQVLQGGKTNNFKDEENYWDAGWPDTRYGGLRYTVFAVYSDGVVPNFADEYKRGDFNLNTSVRGTAYEYVQCVDFDYPVRLIQVSWYGTTNKSTFKILHDGTGTQDLIYSIAYSTENQSLDIPDTASDYNPKKYQIDEYYTGTSATSWNTGSPKQAAYFKSIKPNTDLYYAIKFSLINYTVTYKGPSSSQEHETLHYDNKLIINPVGNARSIISNATIKHTNPKTGEDKTGQYTITPIEDDYNVNPPSQTNGTGLRFAYWDKTVASNGDVTLTAVWEPNSVTITYKGNNNTNPEQSYSESANYNTNYTIKDNDNSLGFISPSAKPYFVNWNTERNGSGTSYIPGQKKKFTSNTTLYAQWGSPWKKVTAIWIYSDTQIAGRVGIKQGNGYWYPYKPWVHKT